MNNFKYFRVLKMAGIDLNFADKVCGSLSEDTLDRLTRVGFDRKLIGPVLDRAACIQNGISDENVNAILDDQNAIIAMKRKYCE